MGKQRKNKIKACLHNRSSRQLEASAHLGLCQADVPGPYSAWRSLVTNQCISNRKEKKKVQRFHNIKSVNSWQQKHEHEYGILNIYKVIFNQNWKYSIPFISLPLFIFIIKDVYEGVFLKKLIVLPQYAKVMAFSLYVLGFVKTMPKCIFLCWILSLQVINYKPFV